MRRAISGAPNPIMVHAEDGEVLLINSEWSDLTGYAESDIPTYAAWVNRSAGSRRNEIPDRLKIMTQLYDGSKSEVAGEFTITTAKGEDLIWNFKTRQLDPLADGRSTVISMVVDVTEERRSQRALEESEKRFRDLVERSIQGIIIRNSSNRIVFANQALAEMSGYDSPEEICAVGSILDLVAPEDRAMMAGFAEARLKGKEAPTIEFRGLCKDGSIFWVSNTARIVEWYGQPHIQNTFVDISDRKRAEETLNKAAQERRRHAAELAQVARRSTLGKMASALAHEVKQPLAAIGYYAEGCLNRLRSPDLAAGDLKVAIEGMQGQARRAAEIVNRIRSFAMPAEQRRARENVNNIIQSAVSLADAEVHEDGVELKLDLADGLPEISLDTIEIEQVLVNLILNGAQAMRACAPGRRSLTLRSRRVDSAGVEITVTDTGPGLPAEIREKIFEPFVTSKESGTGIGLSISRTIIEAHHGQIRADSHPDGGAVFSVTLPTDADGS